MCLRIHNVCLALNTQGVLIFFLFRKKFALVNKNCIKSFLDFREIKIKKMEKSGYKTVMGHINEFFIRLNISQMLQTLASDVQ